MPARGTTRSGPGYFRTLGHSADRRPRVHAARIAGDAPKVAIVNEAFTKKFDLGRDAVGKRMSNGQSDTKLDTADRRRRAGREVQRGQAEGAAAVLPARTVRTRTWARIAFYVRTASDTDRTLRAVPDVMARLDPNLPLEQLKTLPQQVRENVFLDRMISTLSASFAVLATLLAADRPVRRACLHRRATHTRDRPPDGARRRAAATSARWCCARSR